MNRQDSEIVRQWTMYEVGGPRATREKWYPYLDNIDAIIFLAPISCFDEVLDEDPRVNRIHDSLLLWKGICKSRLFNYVPLVLFLNKCDILSRKLEEKSADGARVKCVKDFFPDFGDAEQDTKGVGECEYFSHF